MRGCMSFIEKIKIFIVRHATTTTWSGFIMLLPVSYLFCFGVLPQIAYQLCTINPYCTLLPKEFKMYLAENLNMACRKLIGCCKVASSNHE